MNLGMDWCWYSVSKLCPTLCELRKARVPCPSPSPGVFPSSCSLHWWCHPAISSFDTLFSFCPQSFLVSGTFPMSHLFASDDWMQKYWNFSFSISPSSEYAGLISFKSDWFELLAIQGIFRRLLQYHSSKALILHHSAFFMVQFSQPYMRENHSLEYMDLCQQSNVSAFQYTFSKQKY